MLIRYDDVTAYRNPFLLIARFVMGLTQNNVLNVNRKPGSANRLAPFSSVYSERFRW